MNSVYDAALAVIDYCADSPEDNPPGLDEFERSFWLETTQELLRQLELLTPPPVCLENASRNRIRFIKNELVKRGVEAGV